MPDEKPRLGPWLRYYAERESTSRRQRLTELALGAVATLGFLAVLVGVLWAFVRFPLPTLGGLVGVWATGYVVLTVKSRRAALRERQLRDSANDSQSH
jgi:hypothetical protein